MSETMTKLKAAHLDARKKKDQIAMALLGTLVSEASNVGKSNGNRASTDDEVQSTIRKFIKNAQETRTALADRGSDTADVDAEIAILQTYQPQMMSEDALRAAVDKIVADKPDAKIGEIMGALKAAHGATYDGKLANTVIREKLAT